MTASKDDGMREALLAAQRIADGWQRSLSQSGYWEESDPLTVARALLSSSAAASGVVGELEAALAKIAGGNGYDEIPEDDADWFAAALQKTAQDALDALSSSRSAGGSEVATRACGPTAPTDHL